jgi:iron complex outermembrane receptor protein
MYSAGVYATTEYSLNSNWTFDAGIRYDFNTIDAQKFYFSSRWNALNYNQIFPEFEVSTEGNQILTNPTFDFHNLSGTIGTTHTFTNGWKLISNLSSASRAPNPSELFSDGLHHSLATIELGDLQLKSEQSYKVGISFQGEIKQFGFNIQPYYNYIDNFMLIEPTGEQTTIRGSFPVWEYRQTNARLYGVDVKLSYAYQNFDVQSSFAYVNGEDVSKNMPLINMPPFNISNTIRYNKVSWNNFYISLNHQFIAEQERFPDNNFITDIVNRTTGEFEEVLVDVSTPPDAYHLINLSSGLDFNINKNKLSINVIINNLMNTSYRNYLNRLRYYADEVGTNAMLQLKFNY